MPLTRLSLLTLELLAPSHAKSQRRHHIGWTLGHGLVLCLSLSLSSIFPSSGIAYCKCSVHSLCARRQRLAETHTFRTKRIENPRTPSQLSASPMRMGISLQKHQHAMMYQLLQKHVQPGGPQTFQPCSFANCSQAFAGLPTFCPITFHLLFS